MDVELDRENPSPLLRLPGAEGAQWGDWQPELEAAYLQQLAGVERLEDASSLQLVVNTTAAGGGSIAHLGGALPNLHELNLNGSTLESLRDLGTGFRVLQVLWVSRCGLTSLDGLNGLPALRELYAAYNDIADLQPVDACQFLEVLDVECNCVADPDAVLYLASCSNLQTLTLAGNPAAAKPGYRRVVCESLPSLQSLDDEAVTASDRGREQDASPSKTPAPTEQQQQQQQHDHPASPLPPPPLKAAAACLAAAAAGGGQQQPAGATEQAGSAASPPDAEEVALVVAGIKHARVGVDSNEFREIEMSMLVATADGTDVQLDARPGTSALLPASASTWVRTLRSSREGSLAALRASHAAAAAAAGAHTGSMSPASPCSASPVGSRPPSSQQQRGAPAAGTPERWAIPASNAFAGSHSFGAFGGGGTRRPSSGAGGIIPMTPDSPQRPGSGDHRPGTASRPFSARPGTAASFSARLGTSASAGATSIAASAGLYWAKNRLGAGGEGSGGGGGGPAGAGGSEAAPGPAAAATAPDREGASGSSKLTQGSEIAFGGSFARDLRKWKGAAVVAASSGSAAAASSAGGPEPVAVLGGGNGLSQTLLRSGQLDPKALLEELKRWKLETADKVLYVDPDEGAASSEWAGADAPDALAARSLANGGQRADILQLSSSMDGGGGGSASMADHGPDLTASPTLPGSPLVPPRQPAGAAAAHRRKMVLAKVVRDIAADSFGSSGASISEILATLRPVHSPSLSGHVPSLAWGPLGAELDRPSAHPHAAGPSPPPPSAQQQQQQQAGAQRPGSARSACSSSGLSDHGHGSSAGNAAFTSRPGSREEAGASSTSSGPPHVQRQRSGTSRAPGLPTGPSASRSEQAGYRVTSVAGEVDVHAANPQPQVRLDEG